MPDRDPNIRAAILRSIHQLTAATIALFIAILLVTGWGLYEANKQRESLSRVADQTIGALCTFKSDLNRRYQAGVEFLEDHPNGIPGIPAATLQNSVNNQKSTLDSLAGLPCKGVPN